MARRDSPTVHGMTGLFVLLEPRPLKVAVEDVPARHRQRVLDLGRRLELDAAVPEHVRARQDVAAPLVSSSAAKTRAVTSSTAPIVVGPNAAIV